MSENLPHKPNDASPSRRLTAKERLEQALAEARAATETKTYGASAADAAPPLTTPAPQLEALEAHAEAFVAQLGAVDDTVASEAFADHARQALAEVKELSAKLALRRDQADARCNAIADAGDTIKPKRLSRNSWVWARVVVLGSMLERAWVLTCFRAAYGQLELGRLLALAFEPLEGGGYRYDWSDECARRALGRLILQRCAMTLTSARSVNGSPSHRLVLAGFRLPQALFVTALPRASGKRFSRRTHSRDAKRLAAGGCKIVRPPRDRVPKNEVGPSGQNCNRYMLERIRRRGERHKTERGTGGMLGAQLGQFGKRSAADAEQQQHSHWADLGQWAELQRLERRPRGAAIREALLRRRRDAELSAAVGPPAPH